MEHWRLNPISQEAGIRACVIHSFNEPWTLEDRTDPQPRSGQVLIRIRQSGLDEPRRRQL